jgi:hypothetical protein
MRRLIVIALLAAACGDNKTPPSTPPDDASVTDDAPTSAGGPCLERPGDLPRPSTSLPCELLPPGFVQQKPKGKK